MGKIYLLASKISIVSALAVSLGMLLLGGCDSGKKYSELELALHEFVAAKDARIGVAVIIDGQDTVMVNGHEQFPMMSVYKLPVALAVADYCRMKGVDFDSACRVVRSDLHKDTYSPMMREYGDMDSAYISIRELLEYALQQSDNNASDILLDMVGGASAVEHYLSANGFDGIDVKWSEDEMHRDTSRCHDNSSSPVAMARLIDGFDSEINGDTLYRDLRRMLETCSTGTDRLSAPFAGSEIVIGHKTGTGDVGADGRIMALNDAGYVHLADGHRYTIVVFVASSACDMPSTASIIAEISAMVREKVEEESRISSH